MTAGPPDCHGDALRSSHSARPARDRRGPSLIIVRRADSSNITCSGSPDSGDGCAQIESSKLRLGSAAGRAVPRPFRSKSTGGGAIDRKPKTKPAAVT